MFTTVLKRNFNLPSPLVITLSTLCIAAIACWGITESVTIAAIITLIEVAGLTLVLGALRGEFSALPERMPELLPPMETDIWAAILLGAVVDFYAFVGFEDQVNVAEEVISLEKAVPLAIFMALGIASIFYVLIALVAVLALPLDQLGESKSPMVALLENGASGTGERGGGDKPYSDC